MSKWVLLVLGFLGVDLPRIAEKWTFTVAYRSGGSSGPTDLIPTRAAMVPALSLPAPGAALLAVAGLAIVGSIKRRLA